MSQEINQPGYTPNSSSEPNWNSDQTSAPRNNNKWIYLAIIAVLLGTNIYLFLNRNTLTERVIVAETETAIADSAREAIDNDYKAALARLDDLVSKNTALTNEINDKDGEIERMKKELRTIMANRNATAADLRRARALIGELNAKARTYEERIAELEGENVKLTEANTSLSRERDSIATEKETIKRLGSVLHVSNIRMLPIDVRRSGKEKETGKAKRVDVFRIYFDISENRLVEDGNKELYLRITGPDGRLLSNAAYGSGITTDAEGNSLNYTLVKEVNLVRGRPVQDVTVDWRQESDYQKGTYHIGIYNEGYLIGTGNVALK